MKDNSKGGPNTGLPCYVYVYKNIRERKDGRL